MEITSSSILHGNSSCRTKADYNLMYLFSCHCKLRSFLRLQDHHLEKNWAKLGFQIISLSLYLSSVVLWNQAGICQGNNCSHCLGTLHLQNLVFLLRLVLLLPMHFYHFLGFLFYLVFLQACLSLFLVCICLLPPFPMPSILGPISQNLTDNMGVRVKCLQVVWEQMSGCAQLS